MNKLKRLRFPIGHYEALIFFMGDGIGLKINAPGQENAHLTALLNPKREMSLHQTTEMKPKQYKRLWKRDATYLATQSAEVIRRVKQYFDDLESEIMRPDLSNTWLITAPFLSDAITPFLKVNKRDGYIDLPGLAEMRVISPAELPTTGHTSYFVLKRKQTWWRVVGILVCKDGNKGLLPLAMLNEVLRLLRNTAQSTEKQLKTLSIPLKFSDQDISEMRKGNNTKAHPVIIGALASRHVSELGSGVTG